MDKLLAQIAKFGIVGVISFIVDYVVYRIFNAIFVSVGFSEVFAQYYLLSALLGFTVSVVVNYILSFKFVFERKEDISRKKEFIVFLVLSVIGLGINELCLYLGYDVIYLNWPWLKSIMSEGFAKDVFFKFGATGVVMVYNFISRKIFLEKKD
ncbi:MAG: GtrA family protein [Butyrivibrio sp.]|jgi:putative flippase GtrA|uniref:GtrA family protein n=1 Tax=Butyrivibrio sp. TaxID=28121 RepID=UPI001EC13367|nr:GtrA family protein [Butyrivibrio sp.]MBE5839863.1 GtrA family protein [Butyrivibrio sp.]